MKRALIPIIVGRLLLSPFAVSFSQRPDEPPGSIKLLPDYTHQQLQGIDTRVGRITKKDGLSIQYDIGRLAGNHAATAKEGSLWYKEQIVNGQTLQLAFTKNKRMYATFVGDTANFYATAKTEEDLADFLLMILTYSSGARAK